MQGRFNISLYYIFKTVKKYNSIIDNSNMRNQKKLYVAKAFL